MKIITHNVFPPIPDRQFDWVAYRDGEEENGNYGYGRTEQIAIDELLQCEWENQDAPDFNELSEDMG